MAENMFNYIQTSLCNLDYEDKEITKALKALYQKMLQDGVYSQDLGLAYAVDWIEKQKGRES